MTWLDPRQWLIVVAFLAAAVLGIKFWEHRLYTGGFDDGYSKAQVENAEAKAKLIAKSIKDTQVLQSDKDKLAKEKADAIQELTRVSHRLADSLRNRPSRPASAGDLPTPPSDGQSARGCTAAELYREDAEVVVRESLRADTLRIHLEKCYIQYDRAKAALDSINDAPIQP